MEHQDSSPPRFRNSGSNRVTVYNGTTLPTMPKSATPTSSSTTVTTHLQNIKEEETNDDELTQVDRSSPRVLGRISSTSSSSSNIDLRDNLDMLHEIEKSNTNISLSAPNLHEELGVLSDKGNSKEELALLPPLPHTGEMEITPQFDINEAIFERDDISHSSRLEPDDVLTKLANSTRDATGEDQGFVVMTHGHDASTNDDSQLSATILDNQTSFDLSKALEMTSHSNISNIINSSGSEGRRSRTPVSNSTLKPNLSSPESAEREANTTSSSSTSDHGATMQYDPKKIITPIPVLPSSVREQQQNNAPLRERSRSNSSALASTLRDTIISGLPQNINSVERKLSRKSNRSRKNTVTFEDRLQKLPPLSTQISNQYAKVAPAENNIALHFHNLPTPVSNTQTPVTFQSESGLTGGEKKMPFLRRASSALLRKTSAKNCSNLTRTNTPTLSTSSTFESDLNARQPMLIRRSSTIDNKLPRRQLSCSKLYSRLNSDSKFANSSRASEEVLVSTPNDTEHVYRKTSLGSKIKRGFTRILSDSNNSKEILTLSPKSMVTTGPTELSFSSLSTVGGHPTTPVSKENDRVSIDGVSTFNRASTSLPESSTDDISPLREEGKINVPKRTSSRKILSKNSSKKNVLPEQQTKPSEIYLDKEALQSFVPVLSVTEGTHRINRSSLQTQSTIGLCITNLRNKEGMKLNAKEYVEILAQQQRKEDERYAVLERKFASCRWCSDKDLQYLKKKRISMNKIWSDYVRFYRGKLNNP
ncbi:uncharacterized protein YOL036W [Saccharomyces cerevisiae S288C]|uniref:Uncharacterized protein YOL036W n=2 Tax=Saccharomyces cerevisiae TaxID=4932 RepID=YO036_YEAST|eukprot:NP_014606.1 hypothetical protein YOL036W [Saccharomyces cerevisiae S288C]